MVAERDNVKPDGSIFAAKFDFAVEYLQKQFPWLSKEVIVDAIEQFGDNHSKIIHHLDEMSGQPHIQQEE
jgi:hypothetical protein